MGTMTDSRFEETPPNPEPQPWSDGPGPLHDRRPVREPGFNAPWQAVAVVVLIVGGYGAQPLFPGAAVAEAYAFMPANLVPGRWETAITSIFLHGNWAHALMNGAFALA